MQRQLKDKSAVPCREKMKKMKKRSFDELSGALRGTGRGQESEIKNS